MPTTSAFFDNLGQKQARRHTRDTRAEMKARLGSRVASHLLFAKRRFGAQKARPDPTGACFGAEGR